MTLTPMRLHAPLALVALALIASACGGPRTPYAALTGTGKYDRAKPLIDTTKASVSVMRVTQETTPCTNPALSPDGSLLLYQSTIKEPKPKGPYYTVVGIRPDTAQFRKPYSDEGSTGKSPVWLQDGSLYLFVSDAVTPGVLSLVKASPGAPLKQEPIVKGTDVIQIDHPSASPDGYRVVFQTTAECVHFQWFACAQGKHQIAVARVDGSGFDMLGEGGEPAWSPDGTRIAFVRKVYDRDQIFTIDATGKTDLVQVTKGTYEHTSPSWSPDSSHIVYSTNAGWKSRGGTEKGTWNLYAVEADGKHAQALTSTSAAATTPYWGRDGWIYFASNVLGNEDIYRIKPAPELAKAGIPPAGVKLVDASKPDAPGIKKEFDLKTLPLPAKIPDQPQHQAPEGEPQN